MTTANLEDVYELSPMQQGILFHTLYDPAANAYFEQCIVTLRGRLDRVRFERAWQRLAARHPILKTSFHWEALEKPVQVVHREVEVPFQFFDWSDLPPDVQGSRLDTFLQEDRTRSFDLASPPLFRVALFKNGDELYEYVLSFQHLLLDRWSRLLILKEMIAEYAGRGEPDALPSPRPYGEYIAWLQEQDRGRAEAFWRRTLAGFTTPTPLAAGKAPSGVFEDATLRLSAQETESLQSFARRHRLTLNTLVQGAWAVLASRYGGEDDVLFGATVSGRPPSLPGVESMVGLFINTLPVRVRLPAQHRVLPWLESLQAQLLELREYEHSSLLDIQGWSKVPRGVPLFQSLVIFENIAGDSRVLEGSDPLEVLRVRSVGGGTNYPLTLLANPGRELSFRILADGAFFQKDALFRMLGHLATLLGAMAVEADRTLSNLSLLTEPEHRRLVVDWNDTARDYPQICIHELFERQVARTPDAPAVEFGSTRLTYRELNRHANEVAHYLRELGATAETRVAICLERSEQMLVGLLGILKSGGAYVPLDPTYPMDRLALMIDDAQPSILLTERSVVGRVPSFGGKTVMLDRDRDAIAVQSPANPEADARPD
nr:condensation domain-containing protein [Acidobacteriota bacterium]